jgi:glutamate-1-semialdehyde 2,1-aminomutase
MSKSDDLFRRAEKVMPGGVNSPVRAFKAVGGKPVFIESGSGCRIRDVDGNDYIEYIGSWGPLITGHRPPEVMKALGEVLDGVGTSFGAPTEREVDLAELICDIVPSVEKVRLVNSGTEATMSAIRLARGFTGREKIVKFDGCYHGHGDSLLVRAGSGVATLGLPDSPGVPAGLAALTLVVPFNDSQAIQDLFEREGGEIACVIIEPIGGNMGCVPPEPGYLELVRHLTEASGTVLIFDEVMTGFRVSLGGAQELFNIRPDLSTMGKIIGGGLPVGAYGGRTDIMDSVAPVGPVYQAGTLSGNPLAVAAGLATLTGLRREPPYERLDSLAARLERGIHQIVTDKGLTVRVNRVGSMLTLFFTDQAVTDFDTAKSSDTGRFSEFFQAMLAEGVYWPPSQFEAAFVSTAHSEDDIDATIGAISRCL